MLQWLKHTSRDAAQGVRDYGEAAMNETRLRIAVTGLSRAGKTVFITSLVHNLLALPRYDTLPQLSRQLRSAAGEHRLDAVRVLPPGSDDVAAFDYGEKLAELAAAQPAWPPRTEGFAVLGLDLLLKRTGLLSKVEAFKHRRVRLELMDYPGEWLLDLPLLEQSYAVWSRETLALLRQSPRAEACAGFLALLPDLDPNRKADHALLRQAHALYREGLMACRTRYGLRFLQPGRFVCPGPGAETPLLWFAPLEDPGERPAKGSAAALMRDRFEAYKADMRQRFFDTHFTAFDRQVVLVDVLGALHAGRAAFEDTEKALAAIGTALRGEAGLLSRSLGGLAGGSLRRSAPGRVAFVATKADHVPELRRDNLRHLLRTLVQGDGAPPRAGHGFHVAASVLATVDGTAQRDGRSIEVVRGVPLGEMVPRAFDPGEVPSSRPRPGFWNERFFELPVFAPPRIVADGSHGIPHLNLDAVLAELLEGAL
ncbi:YcjX family protein [Pseudoroseomonas globiformis]|uniref:YcjX family protein n=1 Tax=Teichococcus globiformis TaxID=2307229 RepID=A0ABV7G6P1_9PROT